jgi:uncharacterized protein (UPF0332 family)
MTLHSPPFNWEEYLTLATDLFLNPDEASRRTSISRAYYAVFHAATNHAKINGYNERNHGRLWKMYHADVNRNARKLSTIGNLMKTARECADYGAEVIELDAVAAQQLSHANEFAEILAQVPVTSPQLLPPNPIRTCHACGAIQP